MASAEFTLRLLDMPEVQVLLEKLRELSLMHCHGCDHEPDHRATEMVAYGFKQSFIDGFGQP